MDAPSLRTAGRPSSWNAVPRDAEPARVRVDRGAWDALTAWRLQETYGPITAAVRYVLDTEAPPANGTRVLLIGGDAGIFGQFLSRAASTVRDVSNVEIVSSGSVDGRLPLPDGDVSCAVALDWLPTLAPSVRGTAMAELCRVARNGVVLMHLGEGDEPQRAVRAVNDLHRLTHGIDHASFGRLLEMGLPDHGVVRARLAESQLYVETRGVGSAATWLTTESLAVTMGTDERAPTAADAAAAMAYPASQLSIDGGFRTLFVATARPSSAPLPASPAPSPGAHGLALHQSIEFAAQRRALEALTAAVTQERQTEREEFRAALASLAVDIRELEGRAEALARDVRGRDQTIGNQHVMLTAEAERAAAFQTAAVEAERRATTLHGQFVESERLRRAADERADTLSAHAHQLEARVAAAEPVVAAHAAFVQSRAGRALRAYTRFKQRLLGRS